MKALRIGRRGKKAWKLMGIAEGSSGKEGWSLVGSRRKGERRIILGPCWLLVTSTCLA